VDGILNTAKRKAPPKIPSRLGDLKKFFGTLWEKEPCERLNFS
jgi:hypothetical protein